MSAPHSRLFEASLAALLLADAEEEHPQPTALAPGQRHKPMGKREIRAEIGGSSPVGEVG
jgi:hypothetical protein